VLSGEIPVVQFPSRGYRLIAGEFWVFEGGPLTHCRRSGTTDGDRPRERAGRFDVPSGGDMATNKCELVDHR
jgi:hypothetical protein